VGVGNSTSFRKSVRLGSAFAVDRNQNDASGKRGQRLTHVKPIFIPQNAKDKGRPDALKVLAESCGEAFGATHVVSAI
jgi:hypothetical protein